MIGLSPKRKRRKTRDAEFVVIGLGRFGGQLARRLSELGHTVLGIDTDPIKVQDIADEISDAVVMDATSEDALVEIGIASYDTAVVTLVDSFEACALATITLKNLGVPNIIAIVQSDRHKEILLLTGADRVIQPIQESGNRLAYDLALTGILESISLGSSFRIVEIPVPSNYWGKTIGQLEERQLDVLAILRGNRLLTKPTGDVIILEGDLLVVVGESKQLEKISSDVV